MRYLLFILLFTLPLVAFSQEKPTSSEMKMILETRPIEKRHGDLVLKLTGSKTYYDEVTATFLKDGPGRFGFNIGVAFKYKGESVRTTHITLFDSGNSGLKTHTNDYRKPDIFDPDSIKDFPIVRDTLLYNYFLDLKDK